MARTGFALLCLLFLGILSQRAEATILVFESEPEIEALVDMLRIQLGADKVVISHEQLSGSPGARIEAVKLSLEQTDATFGVWLEYKSEATPEGDYTAFAVRRARQGQTAEVFRIAAQVGFRGDRALALRIAELYLEQQDSAAEPKPASKPSVAPNPSPRKPRWSWEGAPGLVTRSGLAEQPLELSLRLALGAQRQFDNWSLHVAGVGEAALPHSHSLEAGSVERTEWDAGALLRLVQNKGVGVGAEIEAVLRWVSAEASAPGRESRGSQGVVLPALRTSFAIHAALSDSWSLGGAVGVEATAWRQDFTQDGQTALQLNRFSPVARLELRFRAF